MFPDFGKALRPTNHRDWADDVRLTVTGTAQNDDVTLYNVRNFTWRGETDYDQHWETRRYALGQLSSVNLFLSSWSSPAIAHILVSFGFAADISGAEEFVTFSVEVRKTKGQKFSEIAGFFRQYTLALIAADERDIIFVRTNIRKESVSRYRIDLSPEQRRDLFLAYVERGNRLARRPEFYNTLTANCTTVVFAMMRRIVPGLRPGLSLLLSGYLPDYIYRLGGLGKTATLEDLKQASPVTARAQAIGRAENFSREIRHP